MRNVLIAISFFLGNISFGQEIPIDTVLNSTFLKMKDSEFLRAGDSMPNIYFDTIYNVTMKERCIADFRGKLLILDLWSSSCKSCIQGFPKLERLQQRFGDSIQILAVGLEWFKKDTNTIRPLISKWKGTKMEMRLPTIIQGYSNPVFQKLFPLQNVPLQVWISPVGKILAVVWGGADEVSISRALNNESLNFYGAKRFKYNQLNDTLLFRRSIDAGDDKNLISVYGSAIAPGYIDTLNDAGTWDRDTVGSNYRFRFINWTLPDLYLRAYAEELSAWNLAGRYKRVLQVGLPRRYADMSEGSGLDYYKRQDFRRNNYFTYELNFPKSRFSFKDIKVIMKQDLDRYCKVRSFLKDTLVSCLILAKKPNTHLSISKKQQLKITVIDSTTHFAEGMTVDLLVASLQGVALKSYPFVIDETNCTRRIDIMYPYRTSTLLKTNSYLSKYGLELREEKRRIQVLVLQASK